MNSRRGKTRHGRDFTRWPGHFAINLTSMRDVVRSGRLGRQCPRFSHAELYTYTTIARRRKPLAGGLSARLDSRNTMIEHLYGARLALDCFLKLDTATQNGQPKMGLIPEFYAGERRLCHAAANYLNPWGG